MARNTREPQRDIMSHKTARTLMVQGTASSAGKSMLVTALCRIFRRKGLSVAPFKAQNMSLNSFITADGLEMGRAQVAQAEAAGIEPSALMNPILLKPGSDHCSQVIVNGVVHATMDAREYYRTRHTLRPAVLEAFTRLAAEHDLIIIEGAGSPAEINLRENDLANMGVAELADAPVILVGDIDRGGVFASLYGTVALLEPEEQRRIQGVVINKFRGELAILEPGLRQLEELLDRPVLGVLPYMDIVLDEEDSLAERLEKKQQRVRPSLHTAAPDMPTDDTLDIAVLRLPRLSNFTDFAAFDTLPDVNLRYVADTVSLGHPDLLIIPGSKSTIADMHFLWDSGLAEAVRALHATGTPVVGICGGYQMLGKSIRDPEGTESSLTHAPGLGLLDVETDFAPAKRTTRTRLTILADTGLLSGTGGMQLEGYEIHMGISMVRKESQRLAVYGSADSADEQVASPTTIREGAMKPDTVYEGATSPDGMVVGSYLHGFFDNLAFTRTLVNTLRRKKGLAPLPMLSGTYTAFKEAAYDRLADEVEAHLDMPALERIIWDWGK